MTVIGIILALLIVAPAFALTALLRIKAVLLARLFKATGGARRGSEGSRRAPSVEVSP